MAESILILGAGGHGREIADILRISAPNMSLGFIDDNPALVDSRINDVPVIGNFEKLLKMDPSKYMLISGIGNAKVASKFVGEAKSKGFSFSQAIHPSASISPFAKIGTGVAIFENCSVHANAEIGDHCSLNVGSSVSHDSYLGSFSSLNPGARVAGNVSIGQSCYIGMEASIIQGLKIGNRVTIGAGTVVIRNLEDDSRVVG